MWGVPWWWYHQDWDAFLSRCICTMWGLPWKAVQPGDIGSEIQRQEYLRCTWYDSRWSVRVLRACAICPAQDFDLTGGWTWLYQAWSAIDDIIRWRSTANQACDRAFTPQHRQDDLCLRWADNGTSFCGCTSSGRYSASVVWGWKYGCSYWAQLRCH